MIRHDILNPAHLVSMQLADKGFKVLLRAELWIKPIGIDHVISMQAARSCMKDRRCVKAGNSERVEIRHKRLGLGEAKFPTQLQPIRRGGNSNGSHLWNADPQLLAESNKTVNPGPGSFLALFCLGPELRVNCLKHLVIDILYLPEVQPERQSLHQIGRSLESLEREKIRGMVKKLLRHSAHILSERVLESIRIQSDTFDPRRFQKDSNALHVDLRGPKGSAESGAQDKFGRRMESPRQRNAQIG